MKRWHGAALATAALAMLAVGVHQLGPARIGPPDIYPSSDVTGATNLAITQANIAETLCNPSWSTKSIRPPASYTTALKLKQITQYGYVTPDVENLTANPADYEEDHLISLELGGDPTSPQNLWPEPYTASIGDGGAKAKDTVENALHKELCAGHITLQEAQREIVADWYAVSKKLNGGTTFGSLTVDNQDLDDN